MPTNAHRIKTEPDIYEPFRIAQAYRAGDLIFVSGQAALDDTGAVVGAGDFEAQARRSIENLARVLEAGGSGLAKLVKVNILVTDISRFDVVMKLREEYFTPPYPADTICEVRSLALPGLTVRDRGRRASGRRNRRRRDPPVYVLLAARELDADVREAALPGGADRAAGVRTMYSSSSTFCTPPSTLIVGVTW